MRCTADGCNKALTQGNCLNHGRNAGRPDLRLRATLDDGTSTVVLNMGRAPTEAILGKTLEQCAEKARQAYRPEVIRDDLKDLLEGKTIRVSGNAFTDDFGLTLLGDSATLELPSPLDHARETLAALEAI
jgi:ssDNA-binding replication factor A large subunit